MRYLKLGVTFFAFLAITAFVWASESDELREKAKAMQREAAELAERGHREEAANLKRKAMEMLEEAERLEHITRTVAKRRSWSCSDCSRSCVWKRKNLRATTETESDWRMCVVRPSGSRWSYGRFRMTRTVNMLPRMRRSPAAWSTCGSLSSI